jgi:hypothetical protein
MWKMCLEQSISSGAHLVDQSSLGVPASTKGLSSSVHGMAIENFTQIVGNEYPCTAFYYIRESCLAMQNANEEAGPLTMQHVLKKLLNCVSLPIRLPKVNKDTPLNFDKGPISEANYEEMSTIVKSLPRTRSKLVQLIEERLGLTNSCLTSYIQFKRHALGLLMAE